MKFAVVKTGGRQYLVKENDELYIDRLDQKVDDEVDLDTLACGDLKKEVVELGRPLLPTKVKAKVLENLKGEKLRILRFRAKVRYRRRRGFRPYLTKVKIIQI